MISTEKFIGLCENVSAVLAEVRGIKSDMVDLKAEVTSENSAIKSRVSVLEVEVARAKAWVAAAGAIGAAGTGGALWIVDHLAALVHLAVPK